MPKLLHITNGDYAAEKISTIVSGNVLPWRDVLHEGPVPALRLEELSTLRAKFNAERGWGAEAGKLSGA